MVFKKYMKVKTGWECLICSCDANFLIRNISSVSTKQGVSGSDRVLEDSLL
jgi:hypothetical protein